MPAPKRNTADKFLTGRQFQVWRTSRGLTYEEIAEWFGVHPNSVTNYNKVGLTRVQALALAALERGLPPWRPSEKDWVMAGMFPDADELPIEESKQQHATHTPRRSAAAGAGDQPVSADADREGGPDEPRDRS